MKAVFILTFNFIAIVQRVSAICNACNVNGVACTSDNEFKRCEGGQPIDQTTYRCSGNKICTALPAVCVEPTAASAVRACGDTSNCGICEGAASQGTYACTSRSTYTMCLDNALTDIRGTCPENQMCDIEKGKQGQIPCVPNCRMREIQFCDRAVAVDAPVVDTTQSPATTTITSLPETAVSTPLSIDTTAAAPTSTAATFCLQQTAVGYYAAQNDSTCRNYVLCYKKGGVMKATTLSCSTNTYFNSRTRLCRGERPAGCN